ncbi:MAG: hypothetical protein JSS02_02950 [Planctomycetes bacterium]|nr:hypothetical protein [Planctomycetota bacterium]
MALFKRLFGKRRSVKLDLDELIAQFGVAVERWEDRDVDWDLLRAQFADAFRDAGLMPVAPDRFLQEGADLNSDAARRFAVWLTAFSLPETIELLPQLIEKLNGNSAQLLLSIKAAAQSLVMLTPSTLRQSDVRLEEFARHFCSRLHIDIQGETREKAARRLHEIDYARLVEEAERAKNSATERMEYLRKLQDAESETRRPRRGKW